MMMIERYQKLADFLRPLCQSEACLMEYALNDEESLKLRVYLDILKPFKVATDHFSCSKSQNLGAVVPIYREMKRKMIETTDLNDRLLSRIGSVANLSFGTEA